MNPMGTGSGADIFGDLVSKVPARRAGGLDDMAGVVLFGRTLFANGQV